MVRHNRIKHHYHNKFAKNYMQATSVDIELNTGNQLTLAAVYCPPRFTIAEDEFMQFYNSLGDYFIAAGDYNAKHTHWGSLLVTPREKEPYNANIKAKNKLDYVSFGRPTYWPADPKKLPDLIGFAITKNIPKNLKSAKCFFTLSLEKQMDLPRCFIRFHIAHLLKII